MSVSFFIDNAQLGILVTAGKKIIYIGTDNKVYTLEYNGTDWIDRLAEKADKMLVVNQTESNVTIADNTYNIWGEVANLNLSIASDISCVIEFKSGDTATTLSVPSDLIFADEISIEANKTYHINILKGVAVWMSY